MGGGATVGRSATGRQGRRRPPAPPWQPAADFRGVVVEGTASNRVRLSRIRRRQAARSEHSPISWRVFELRLNVVSDSELASKALAACGKFPDWSGEAVAGEHGGGLIGSPFRPIRVMVASIPFAGKSPHLLDGTHVALGLAPLR